MFTLKPLHKNAIPEALAKAERYRLLNEPGEAESICLDVLEVDPENQEALRTLLLALTDQFERGPANRMGRALEVLPRLATEYERYYYHGVVCERRAKAAIKRRTHGHGSDAYDWLVEAMEWYEKAEGVRPPDNDDAQLRWNACARKIMDNKDLKPREEESFHPLLE
jgi:hypothetical protein